MLASDVIRRAATILLDLTKVRWTEAELLDYITDGQSMIVFFRPDANTVNVPLQLVGGTRQSIPADGIRFMRATRNMGSTGLAPGRSVRECSRVALDNEDPDWHFANPKTTVEHFVFDNADPKHFFVYPCVSGALGVAANVYLDIAYSKQPAAVTSTSQTLELADTYLTPLLDWVLYRCFSKDAQYAGNMARAQSYMQSFGMALDLNMKIAFGASSPQYATPTPAAAPQVQRG